MTTYKCDRCGKYYDEPIYYPIEAEPFSVIMTSAKGVDLCRDCADSLADVIKKWVEGKENGKSVCTRNIVNE